MKPLGSTERKLILIAELYERRHGRAATWAELHRTAKVPRRKASYVLLGLRKKGLIEFDDSPRSLRLRPGTVARVLRETA